MLGVFAISLGVFLAADVYPNNSNEKINDGVYFIESDAPCALTALPDIDRHFLEIDYDFGTNKIGDSDIFRNTAYEYRDVKYTNYVIKSEFIYAEVTPQKRYVALVPVYTVSSDNQSTGLIDYTATPDFSRAQWFDTQKEKTLRLQLATYTDPALELEIHITE